MSATTTTTPTPLAATPAADTSSSSYASYVSYLPPQLRHTVVNTFKRVSTSVVLIIVIILCVLMFAYRTYVYFYLTDAVFAKDATGARWALHMLSTLRGSVLVLAGLVYLFVIVHDYYNEPQNTRHWTVQDSIEVVIAGLVMAWGVLLFVWRSLALVK